MQLIHKQLRYLPAWGSDRIADFPGGAVAYEQALAAALPPEELAELAQLQAEVNAYLLDGRRFDDN